MHLSMGLNRSKLRKLLQALCFVLVTSGLSAQAAVAAAPKISGTPGTWVYVGQKYYFKPTASDADGQTLKFSIANKPAWASFSTSTGLMSGTPSAVGLWNGIKISVTDGTTTVALPGFSVRAVSRNNVAPTISGTPPTTATVGVAYKFQAIGKDANGDPLVYEIANKPTWASFDKWTGVLSGTPSSSHIGKYSNIQITVRDGGKYAKLAAFSITVSASSTTNRAPAISGTPPTSAQVGTAYSFRPSASDPDGNTLGFTIQNRPSWASFSTTNGTLSGTPTTTGTHSNIIISVSDGSITRSLAAFSIAVAAPTQPTSRNATLSWTAPTRNSDGSTLTNLAGYRIHYGSSASVLAQTIQISNAGITTYVIENLAPGTYYFAVKAYSSGGTESELSNVVSKTIQ